MKNEMVEWFKWNDAANRSFIHSFQERQLPEKCVQIFNNIIDEHELWINRICAVDIAPRQAKNGSTHLSRRNAMMFDLTQGLLSSESYGSDFNWQFSYKRQDGKTHQCSLGEVYFHILTFSEYHRGQVAELLKENGIAPPSTDYLTLKNS